jgi:hypothetical protein
MSSGAFTGTPTVLGASNFTLTLQDSTSGTPKTNTFPLTIQVTNINQYGGDIALHCPAGATGAFYTALIGAQWYICDPLGNGMWGLGAYLSGPQGNITAKYLTSAAANLATAQRLKSWGFNILPPYVSGDMFPSATGMSSAKMGYMPIFRPGAYGMQKNAVAGPLDDGIKDLSNGTGSYFTDVNYNGIVDWADTTRQTSALHYMLAVNPNDFATILLNKLSLDYILGIAVEDSDQTWAFWGGGEGDPFETQPSGRGSAHGGYIAALMSPIQQAEGDHWKLLYTDHEVKTKTNWQTYLQTKYNNIAALNTAWSTGGAYTTFGSTATPVSGESFATTDGTNAAFTHTLSHAGTLSPNTVQIYLDGTMVAGDCFHPGHGGPCNNLDPSTYPNKIWGGLYGPTMSTGTGLVNYSTKAVTVVFNAVPGSGHAITVSYQVNGWDAGGTGLMDEDGRPTHTWLGTDPYALTNANANFAADCRAWLGQLATTYFSAIQGQIAADFTSVGAAVPMYLGPDTFGTWSTPPRKEVLQAAGPYIGMAIMGASPGFTQSELDFVTQYFGKPFLTATFLHANADSPYASNIAPGDYATQQLRGAAYIASIQGSSLAARSNGVNPNVGNVWWSYPDGDCTGSTCTNWGLVTLKDNAYDGHEAAMGSVTCSSPTNAYTCGGESGNYGNLISSITIANGLWLLIGN